MNKYNFIKTTYYEYGNIAIVIEEYDEEFKCYEPYGSLTVNLKPLPKDKNIAFLDVNSYGVPEIISFLEKEGLIISTGIAYKSGFVTYPLYELTDKFLNQVCTVPEGMEE